MHNSKVEINPETVNRMVTIMFLAVGMVAMATMVDAGGTATTMFDGLATESDNAVFGPLGQTIIALAAAAGGLFAIMKGSWILAGLGIAVAALMFGAQLVAGSSGFGALI